MRTRLQNRRGWHGVLTVPGERAAAVPEQGLQRAALQRASGSSSPPGRQQALLLCRASTLCPRPQLSPLPPRALSSHPPPRRDCRPCFHLSCQRCCQRCGAISRQSCSRCSAQQHHRGARCDVSALLPSHPLSHRRLENTSSLRRGQTSSSWPSRPWETQAPTTRRRRAASWRWPWQNPPPG